METMKQLSKSSMDEQDWGGENSKKGGISEWHVHKRRGKVIVAYNKVNRATDLLPYPEEPQMQNNTQLPFEKSAVLKRKPGRVEGRL